MMAYCAVNLSVSDSKKLTDCYRHYLSIPNIVSISYCDEKKRDRKTGRKVLCFGVVRKLKCEDITAPNVLLPKSVSFETEDKVKIEIPVQVVEEGEIVALSAPYKGGSSIKTETIDAKGTLGANTHYKGVYRLLSGAHVLTQFDESNIGKKVLVSSDGEHFEDTIATVTGQVNVVLYDKPAQPAPVYAKQDLAWANITEDKGSPEIKEIGRVGNIRDPVLKELVQFYGAESEDLAKDLEVLDVSAKLAVRFKINGANKYGYFEDVVKFDITEAAPLPGDSGSAIIAQNDKTIVGILMSSSMFYGYFTKLTY